MNRRFYFDSSEEAIQYVKKNNILMVDLKFIDLVGHIRHVTLSASALNGNVFTEGVGFDGSSVTKFRSAESGDLNLIPDPTMAILDPFWELPTLSFFCKVVEADRPDIRFSNDPRYVAQKAEQYLKQLHRGHQVLIGPEAEFFLFNEVSYNNAPNFSSFHILSEETHRDKPESDCPPTPHQLGILDGYHRSPPEDHYFNIRAEMTELLEECGVKIKYHHHEVGGAGQQEIELQFNTLVNGCDDFILLKYIVKNTARKHGMVATFMPKPLYAEPGNGMHIHIFLADEDGKSLFYHRGADFADFSDTGISFITGILEHGRSLLGFTNPSTNSYRRLVPGYEAPTQLFFSMANRCAAIRIPKYAHGERNTRMEFRPPDATCNIYLAASALLMAGLDGVERGLMPAHLMGSADRPSKYIGPVRGRLEDEPPALRQLIEVVPINLEEALTALRTDHAYLAKELIGKSSSEKTGPETIFSPELIDGWCDVHLKNDVQSINQRPTPYEFQLYLNC